jgi:hypothetical protein
VSILDFVIFALFKALALILNGFLAVVGRDGRPREFPSFKGRSRRIGPKLVADQAHSLNIFTENIINIDVVFLGYLL